MTRDRPNPLDVERIERENLDIADRLFNEGVYLMYDEDGDTLFLTIGDSESQPHVGLHVIDGMYYEFNPETYKLVGCTILAFASDFLAANKLMRKAFPNAIGTLRAHGGEIHWTGRDAQRVKTAFDFAELISTQ